MQQWQSRPVVGDAAVGRRCRPGRGNADADLTDIRAYRLRARPVADLPGPGPLAPLVAQVPAELDIQRGPKEVTPCHSHRISDSPGRESLELSPAVAKLPARGIGEIDDGRRKG